MGLIDKFRRSNRQRTSFATVAAHAEDLIASYRAGQLSPQGLAEALAANVHVDRHGTEWTIGASTGAWYSRKKKGTWKLAEPPEGVPRVRIERNLSRGVPHQDPFDGSGNPLPAAAPDGPPGGVPVNMPDPSEAVTAESARFLTSPEDDVWSLEPVAQSLFGEDPEDT